MRTTLLASIPCLFLGLACSSAIQEGSATDSSTGTDSDSESSTSNGSTTASTSSGTASGSASDSASDSGGACVPGMSVACACPDGGTGAQVCNPDGNSLGPCECAGGTSPTPSTTTDPTDGTTTDPTDGTTTDEPTTGTTTDEPTTGTTTTGEPVCEDSGVEPNDAPEDSVQLANLGCNDGPESFAGVLNGADDVDWYTYNGQWGQGCGFGDPDTVTTVTADEAVRLCVYADCFQGQTNINCPNNLDDDAVQGVDGCCGTGEVAFTVDCNFTANKSAQVWIRLDEAPADSCVEYSVDYVYND